MSRWNAAFQPDFNNHEGKVKTLLSLQGPGSKNMMQSFHVSRAFPGELCSHLRCLGEQIHHQLSMAPERSARIVAIRSGWRSLGAFWFSKSPFAVKRELFNAKVFSPALSAATAFPQKKTDTDEMDALI